MLLAVMEKLQSDLSAAGIVAVLDAAKASPPCAIVQPPSFEVRGVGGLVDTETSVSLIAKGRGDLHAAADLLGLAELAIGATNVVSGRPVVVSVGPIDYPGYELTVKLAVRN